MQIFDINPDIRKAETLSSEFYTDEKYFHESKEKIFARSWQLIGRADEIDNLKPKTILENFLDEPILLTKTGEKLNCLSNVCTHRGNILIESSCKTSGIRCGYHGRRFDLEGKFLSMPEFETAENFPSEKDDLAKIPFGIWQDFLFASINPFATFEEFIAEMNEKLKDFEFENLKFSSAKDYEVKAHWALYCENYLEGLHIPFVHQSLNAEIDWGFYFTEHFRYSILQTAFDKKHELAAHYFFIFPNLMFNFYPWGISVNIIKPLKKDLTKVSYLTFVSDESKLNKGAGADLETVEFEDQEVVESVQKGINSRFYDKGRYSPAKEKGTHHFHRLIAEFMN
jgi:choline monooxygenase